MRPPKMTGEERGGMATYTVSTASDADDDGTVTGDLTAETADGGGLSLREAVLLANGDDEDSSVSFADALSGATIALEQGSLQLTNDMVIDGDIDGDGTADVTLDAQGISRVLEVQSGRADLGGLVVTGGQAGVGGGISVARGATLAFADGTIRDNAASVSGGGVQSAGTLALTRAVVSGNEAAAGGGVGSSGTLTVTGGTISGNSASQNGGGIGLSGGVATLAEVTLRGNDAQYGGGIDSAGALTLAAVTLSNNSALIGGGGVSTLNGSTAALINVTLAGNTAEMGGAMQNNGATTLTNATLTGNAAAIAGGVKNYGSLSLANTIILANEGGAFDGRRFDGGSGNNLVRNDDDVAAEVFAALDPDTLGGFLSDNGGPVETVALAARAGNRALDAGNDATAPATDARGQSRPVDLAGFAGGAGESDLGAYELRDEEVDPEGDDATVIEDGTLASGEAGVLANDETSEGRRAVVIAVGGAPRDIGQPVSGDYGTLTLEADGSWVYAADADAADPLAAGDSATDAFEYTVADGLGGSDTATLTLTVQGRADAVAVLDGPAEVREGDAATYTLTFDRLDLADSGTVIGFEYAFTADATAGTGDFSGMSGSGTIDVDAVTSGAASRSFDLEALADDDFEGPETLSLDIAVTGIAFADGSTSLSRQITLGDVPPTGGSGRDEIRGGPGDDAIDGRGGRDELYGGDGRDTLRGNSGDDRLSGQGGRDRLYGGKGDDDLRGGDGDDRLFGRAGDDTLRGGRGDDRLRGDGDDDELYGGRGADRLWGGDKRDLLEGRQGRDVLRGEGGRDRLDGGEGDDRLRGGRNDDRLDGGEGDDSLHGGSGEDVFRFAQGRDRILDFDADEDRIRLEDALWRGRLDAREILDEFGSVKGGDAVLDFGDGDRLRIEGIGRLSELEDHLTFG